jgi:hypothetical protein
MTLLLAGLVHRLFRFVGEALAIGRLVLDEGDVPIGEVACEIFAGDAALLVVAAAYPIDVRTGAVVGKGRIGGCRRDLHPCR